MVGDEVIEVEEGSYVEIQNKIIQQELLELIKDKKLTYDILSNLTKINSQWFVDFVDGKK